MSSCRWDKPKCPTNSISSVWNPKTFPPNPFFQEQSQMLKMTHLSRSVIQAKNMNWLLSNSLCFFPHATVYQILLLLYPKCTFNPICLCHCSGPGLCYFPSGSWRSLLIGLQFILHIPAATSSPKGKSSRDPQLPIPHVYTPPAGGSQNSLARPTSSSWLASLWIFTPFSSKAPPNSSYIGWFEERDLSPAFPHGFAGGPAHPCDHPNLPGHPQGHDQCLWLRKVLHRPPCLLHALSSASSSFVLMLLSQHLVCSLEIAYLLIYLHSQTVLRAKDFFFPSDLSPVMPDPSWVTSLWWVLKHLLNDY